MTTSRYAARRPHRLLIVPALVLAAAAPATAMAAGPDAGAAGGAAAPAAPHYLVTRLAGTSGATEPRNATTPDGRLYTMTNADDAKRTAIVLGSADGGREWTRTAGVPSGQSMPSSDVDVVATRTGRLIASELDFTSGGAINFQTSYSDDRGATWTPSTGALPADTDRQWYAVGPDDRTTHQPRVYLLFHNLLSGEGNHNMFVQTSTDGGATFGAPVPTTLPGDQAYADLQCADSGGPSSIAVGPTGQLYVTFGTRSSAALAPLGGCAASVTPGPFEVNVVNATRVWVATSADGSTGSWTQSLAVDRTDTGQIVGMQLSPGAVDRAGNVYVVFPESRSPSDFAAAIKYVSAPADLSHWSAAVTVAPLSGAGNVLAHIVAGDDGRLGFTWWHGDPQPGTAAPLWFQEAGQTLDGRAATPAISHTRVSDIPLQSGTAAVLMGACGSGPAAGVQNGFTCSRSTDVNGVALDGTGRMYLSWPAQMPKGTDRSRNATYVATALDGPSLFADSPAAPAAGGVAAPPAPTAAPVPPTPTAAPARSTPVRTAARPVTRRPHAPVAARQPTRVLAFTGAPQLLGLTAGAAVASGLLLLRARRRRRA